MKKVICIVLALVLALSVLTACGKKEEQADRDNFTATTLKKEDGSVLLFPLAQKVDVENLTDCTVVAVLDKAGVTETETGCTMSITVYDYNRYDMVDISLLKVGDTLVRSSGQTVIESKEELENGAIAFNGGLEQGGFELHTDEDTVYYEMSYNNLKDFFYVGVAELPVSPDFVYEDASQGDPMTYTLEMLLAMNESEWFFNPSNTTIVIENGQITRLNRR